MSATDRQVGGEHYKGRKHQPWDIADEWNLDHWSACAVKYILRDKDDKIEDLEKAIHCLEYRVEKLRGREG
jgi:hypothetical protein